MTRKTFTDLQSNRNFETTLKFQLKKIHKDIIDKGKSKQSMKMRNTIGNLTDLVKKAELC
jgi:hypothetical protein